MGNKARMTGTIYGLIDSDTLELRYVGKTIHSLKARLRRHRNHPTNPHLRNWLRARPVNIIILERDPVDLDEAEMCWIADMRVAGARLLNMTDGGTAGWQHTPETRAKMNAARIGRPVTAETRAKLSAALMGRTLTVETRAKMSAAKMGCTVTAGHRAKLRAANLGMPWSSARRTAQMRKEAALCHA